ncbi:Mss4-like protein [Mycena rosella]|uniref:Mss4-like protein n=1 Tax=Mycena rosella TaxID=1033263 RepID=A0AAD7D1Q0_MYCRO|nr:Mss4-like protein [Mycena rosella]
MATNSEPGLPPGVLTALLPRRNRPIPTALASFPGGIADVSTPDGDSLYNKFDLLCPRPECGSIILRAGVAKLLERPSIQMEPADRTPAALLPLPQPPASTEWWLVTPSPMEFENIGFSKPVAPLSSGDKQLKLLLCAQCDLGPLGWSEVDGTEFWLACSRVGYRADS